MPVIIGAKLRPRGAANAPAAASARRNGAARPVSPASTKRRRNAAMTISDRHRRDRARRARRAGQPMAQHGPGDMLGGFHGEIDFVAIDTDGNGVLTRAELQARAAERLARADANGDGSLDRAEIVALMPGPARRLPQPLRRGPGRAHGRPADRADGRHRGRPRRDRGTRRPPGQRPARPRRHRPRRRDLARGGRGRRRRGSTGPAPGTSAAATAAAAATATTTARAGERGGVRRHGPARAPADGGPGDGP